MSLAQQLSLLNLNSANTINRGPAKSDSSTLFGLKSINSKSPRPDLIQANTDEVDEVDEVVVNDIVTDDTISNDFGKDIVEVTDDIITDDSLSEPLSTSSSIVFPIPPKNILSPNKAPPLSSLQLSSPSLSSEASDVSTDDSRINSIAGSLMAALQARAKQQNVLSPRISSPLSQSSKYSLTPYSLRFESEKSSPQSTVSSLSPTSSTMSTPETIIRSSPSPRPSPVRPTKSRTPSPVRPTTSRPPSPVRPTTSRPPSPVRPTTSRPPSPARPTISRPPSPVRPTTSRPPSPRLSPRKKFDTIADLSGEGLSDSDALMCTSQTGCSMKIVDSKIDDELVDKFESMGYTIINKIITNKNDGKAYYLKVKSDKGYIFYVQLDVDMKTCIDEKTTPVKKSKSSLVDLSSQMGAYNCSRNGGVCGVALECNGELCTLTRTNNSNKPKQLIFKSPGVQKETGSPVPYAVVRMSEIEHDKARVDEAVANSTLNLRTALYDECTLKLDDLQKSGENLSLIINKLIKNKSIVIEELMNKISSIKDSEARFNTEKSLLDVLKLLINVSGYSDAIEEIMARLDYANSKITTMSNI